MDVARIWRRGADASDPAVVLTGSSATEGAFKRMASGHRVLHVATHAFVLTGDCASSYEFGNPLQLSGLVLAGANRRSEAGTAEEDGILTAEEIAALDLTATELAVLSGCDTGVGAILPGEVLGLRRAFRIAGVPTLLMTLWPVRDATARAWTRAFYEGRLEREAAIPEATRAATLHLLQRARDRLGHDHPFTWAPFVATGDWR